MWLNFHHLYYFMLVATEGSIAAVAKKLNMGPPALSIQIKQLEESLGTKLFERSHKRLTLTEHGKAALAYAREIFELGGELVATMSDQPSEKRVHVQIGALDSIPKHVTLSLAETALATNKCTLSIVEGRADELVRELTQHRLDLVLTNRNPLVPAGSIYRRKIATEQLLIIGSERFLPAMKNFPRSLDGLPFLLPTEESQVRHEIEHYFQLQGLRPDFVCESQDMMVLKLMALRGLGVIAAPSFAVREYLENKKLFAIGALDGVYEELFLIAASRKIENPVATRLLKEFKIETDRPGRT